MACNIEYNIDGTIRGVYNDSGSLSKIYKDAKEKFGAEKALELFYVSQSNEFKETVGENVDNLKSVTRFVAEQNKNTAPMTTENKVDFINLSISIPNLDVKTLTDAFYDEFGMFVINPKKLKATGYYNDYEIAKMAADTNLQQTVKSTIEALNNETELPTVNNTTFENVETKTEVNSFGKMVALNPFEVENEIEQTLGDTTEEEFEQKLADLPYKTEKPSIKDVVAKLEKSGLANNVYQMTDTQIQAKLIELGVTPDVAKQVNKEDASEYFIRNADRLPLTLSVFNRPEFVKLQGKEVNPITVLNSLNQSGIKQIEKDLIKQVIQDNFQGQKKISYDELEAVVRANIMPLERISTSSYADYGMDKLGNGEYGSHKTLILNAPIEHGVTGHFSRDFKANQRQNIKYIAKPLDANTWVAVEEGYEANANDNNIYQYVGTAGTKEAVDAWIENYNKLNGEWVVFEDQAYRGEGYLPSKLLKAFNTEEEANQWIAENKDNYQGLLDYIEQDQIESDINKGMFGHIRVWQDGDVFYTAELQSDYFQKNNARKNFISKNKEYQEIQERVSVKNREINRKESEIDSAKYKISVQDWQNYVEEIINSGEYKIDYEDSLTQDMLKDPITKVEFRNASNNRVEYRGVFKRGDRYDINEPNYEGISKLIAEGLQLGIANNLVESAKAKGIELKTNDAQVKSLEEELNSLNKELKTLTKEAVKKEEELLSKATPQEKQFIASQKEWEKRMVREAIKEASLSGATSLRFPTPYTLSVIEGYIRDENSDSTKLPYSIIQNLQYGSEYNDENGNLIELKPTDLITIEGQVYVVTRTVDDYIKVKNVDYDKSLQYNEEKFEEEFGEKVKVGVNQVNGVEYSYTGEGMIYFLQGGQETFGQPSNYINQEAKKSWNFKISDLNDTQQTVARKYEEIAQILKNERGDNFKVITDENGFDWYETDIESQEANNPVIAFQNKPSDKGISVTTTGFVYKGDVYLNSDKMSLDTPIHEFGHLFLNYLKKNSPEVYQRGLELANSADAKKYMDFVERNQPNLTGEAKLNEILAQAIGENGAELVNKSWLRSFWEEIKKLFGLTKYSPEQIQKMTLKQFTEAAAIDLLNEDLKAKMQEFVTAKEYSEVDGEVRETKNTETEVILQQTAKVVNPNTVNKVLDVLSIDDDILYLSPATEQVLKEIEQELAQDAIDVIGLSERPISRPFLSTLLDFIMEPSRANTKMFAEAYDEFFGTDLSPKTIKIKEQKRDADYVKLNTLKTEEELYETNGLVKVKEGVYIQTAKQSLEELYTAMESYSKDIRKTVQTELGKQNTVFNNSENAEAIILYKQFYGIKPSKTDVKITSKIEGDYTYLVENFPSYFYAESLKEKLKDSPAWNNFYSKFGVNEKGLYLKSTDEITLAQIKQYATQDLKEYSAISRQMPNLMDETESMNLRDTAVNYPETVKNFKGQVYKLNNNEVILKNTTDSFLKIGNEVYENMSNDGNLSLYHKIDTNKTEYLQMEVEKPQTNTRLIDYIHLNQTPDKFKTVKNYLTVEQKSKIVKDNFQCN